MTDTKLATGKLTADDLHWPYGFAGLNEHRPEQLYYQGNVELLGETGLAVVGSRAATPYGCRVATDLAQNAVQAGYVIVSGGAFGIDAAAHRAAPDRTIVVLPCGVDRMYPSAHSTLFRQILRDGGLLVSEYPADTHPTRTQFLDRNRLIAALAQGAVVVEAGLRSGSMAMARCVLQLGRPLMAVPGPVTSACSAGCHELIRNHGATLVTDFGDVYAALGPMPL